VNFSQAYTVYVSLGDTRKPQCHLCRHLGAQCTYPRFSIKPGPKKNPRNKDVLQRMYRATTAERFSLHDPSAPLSLVSTTNPRVASGGEKDNSSRYECQMAASSLSHLSTIFDRSPMISIEPPLAFNNILPMVNMVDDRLLGDSSNLFIRSQSPAQPSRSDLLLPPREVIDHLVEVFFVAVQPQFRLLHRPTLSQQLHDPAYLSSDGSILLLNAIFALSARYSDDVQVEIFDMSLVQASDRKASLPSTCYQGKRHRERGKGFTQLASKLLQDKITEADRLELKTSKIDQLSIQVLQAAALLSFAELGAGVSRRAHDMISMCARLSYDFGLHELDRDEYPNQLRTTADFCEYDWVRKEGLRRIWWCIWDLDNFICTATCRPRMMRTFKCQTKLPVNDKDWFHGHEVPSTLLPGDIRRLLEFLKSSSLLSAMAYRIVSCHLLATLIDVLDNESLDEVGDSVSVIEGCVAAWKESLPKEFRTGGDLQQLLRQSEVLSDLIPMHIECEL
jgi:hypothetical protein